MSRHGDITLPFGDRERVFRLGVAQWQRIDEKCKVGPEVLAARLAPTAAAVEANLSLPQAIAQGLVGQWRDADVNEVIYQGLLGGDERLSPVEVGKLMVDLVYERDKRLNATLAYAIVMASLVGVEGDPAEDEPPKDDPPPGEHSAAAAPSATQPAASASPISTAAAGGRGSRRRKSDA